MRQLDPVRLGHQTQKRTVGIERPGTAILLYLQAMFVIPVEDRLGNGAVMITVHDIDRLIADPVDRNDMNGLVRGNAAHRCTVLDLFELRPHRHYRPLSTS